MVIKCSNPRIILRHDIKFVLSSAVYISLGHNWHFSVSEADRSYWYYNTGYDFFSRIRKQVTKDTIQDYYVVDSNGVITMLFQMVPCGKCRLCREKKCRDWQCRCLAETMYSKSVPLFVTLTFNDKYVDKVKGVDKRDIQLFMKRLRGDLSRKYFQHSDIELRFIAVGEYGSNSGRPHYHLILWNFPDMRITEALEIIEDAWSDHDDQLGYVYLKPCNQGAVSYVLKYMRKGSKAVNDQLPEFWLASRGGRRCSGGIGYQYAQDYADWYRSNPDVLDISISDAFTGAQFSYAIPQYYKDKWFPSKCRLVQKEIRDAIYRLSEVYNWYSYICDQYGYENLYTYVDDLLHSYAKIGLVKTFSVRDDSYITSRISSESPDYFFELARIITEVYPVLKDFYENLDLSYYYGICAVTDQHKEAVNDYVMTQELTEDDVCEAVYRLERSDLRRLHREVF